MRGRGERPGQTECAFEVPTAPPGAGGKLKYGLDLFARYVALLNDFVNTGTDFEVFKDSSDGHPRVAKHSGSTSSVSHTFNGGTGRPVQVGHNKSLLD